MKRLFIVLIVACLQGCGSVKYHPVTYTPVSDKEFKDTFTSTKTKEEVWSKLIEFFAKSGSGIKVIDKSSGLIVTEKTDFEGTYTVQNEEGFLLDKDALLVCSHYSYINDVSPNKVLGNWNVRVFEENGKTLVNVNITNVDAKYLPENPYSPYQKFECKTTGLFEKRIFEIVNK